MIRIKQTTDRNCFAACIASITEHDIENIPCIHDPKFTKTDNWFDAWNMELDRIAGFTVCEISSNAIYDGVWFNIYGHWIATVPSLNLVGKNHAIVMKGGAVAFDPSSKNIYKTGTLDTELDVKMYSFIVPTL